MITYTDCLVLWVSKLQTEVALSTTEAEYIALSQSMRDLIPFMTLHDEICEVFKLKFSKPTVKCTVFEDN